MTRTAFLPILLLAPVMLAQSPQFEVASIRPSQAPQGQNQQVNIGLKIDGQQARIISFTLRDYIAMAYRTKIYQVLGPDWVTQARFDVTGTMPAGAKSDQVPEMLKALLAERFQLKFHNEKRELPVYTMGPGKGPLLLKEVQPDPSAPAERDTVAISGNGSGNGVAVNLGNGSSYTFANNKWEGKKLTLAQVGNQIERYLDRPVVDQTGLKGRYDITIEVAQEDAMAMLIRAGIGAGVVIPPQALRLLEGNTMGSLFDGFEKVGLKLEAKKLPQDVIVVDSALKMPTEN